VKILEISRLDYVATPPSQAEVVAYLSKAENYPAKPATVERIDTHGAMVFLAGDEVWKIKRDIDLPYMDFSTLEKRRAVCWREVELNRQTAPRLYLGAIPICRDRNGQLNLEGGGEPVEWAVKMRRFPQEALLEAVASRGALTDDVVRALATHIADYHAKARKAIDLDFASTMQRIAVELTDGFTAQPDLFALPDQQEIARRIGSAVTAQSSLLRKRSHDGFVRRCHGDLHLRNIVILDGSPVLFDALEFDEGFATTDVLYDVAFLVMDLWQKGFHHQANLLLNRYLISIGIEENISGLAAMPLFIAVRAGIRAMVSAEGAHVLSPHYSVPADRDAIDYFQAAIGYLQPESPCLVAVGGLSGTGKSTLAATIAHLIGPPPGALHLRSDVERKLLYGVPETYRLEAAAYSRIVTQKVYDALMRQAASALAAGRSVIVDAVFSRSEEREAVEKAARDAESRFLGIWLSAPSDLLLRRVAARSGDASDADRAVVRQQLTFDTGAVNWNVIDTEGSPATARANAEKLLVSSAQRRT
jgi:aminoglycoside phosphotransferase family enzyme/predicted kinase